ncbi:DNA polymerase III subunit gamma/tau [Patescibacteria group bacterium]|nr:DNA polymerase III subunit gamma/tau [Patescibacteria group bacterium]
MEVLYRVYRPKFFSEIIGQEQIKTTLQKAVAAGAFAHAYLFTGPRGTGKTSAARIFARAINCEHGKNGEPDNSCSICKQFLDGTSLDLVEIDAASNTGVENIREIIEHLKFSPSQAKYKVFIIDEVHMLSKGAFNALLKTLEEPPAHAVFILATTEVHKVPATVISRTQRFDFRKISGQQLSDYLAVIAKKEKMNIDKPALELIANAAEGSVRDALSILDKVSGLDKIDLAAAEQLLGITNVIAAQKFLDVLDAKDAKGALDYLQELFAAGVDPVQFNRDFLEYLRKVLMVGLGAKADFALDESQISNLKRHAESIKTNALLYIIRLFLRANKDFQISPNAELPLEIAAAEACLQGGESGASIARAESVKKNDSKPRAEGAENPGRIVSKAELVSSWPKIMAKFKEEGSSMVVLMQQAAISDVNDNMITMRFGHKFHKDAMEQAKNREAFLKVLDSFFGVNFGLHCELAVEKTEPAVDAGNALMDVFGGEIV